MAKRKNEQAPLPEDYLQGFEDTDLTFWPGGKALMRANAVMHCVI